MQYLESGADIIETNTFNGTTISQADYELQAEEEVRRETACMWFVCTCLKQNMQLSARVVCSKQHITQLVRSDGLPCHPPSCMQTHSKQESCADISCADVLGKFTHHLSEAVSISCMHGCLLLLPCAAVTCVSAGVLDQQICC
jgi:hypothetical protein